jgi:hypothetical protein
VYHNHPNCQTGNSIKPENILQGTGNKPLCGECEKLNNAGGPVGNLTNLQLFSTSAGQYFSTLRLTPSLVSGFRLLGR